MKNKIRIGVFIAWVFIFVSNQMLIAQEWRPDSVYQKGRNIEFFDSTLIASNKAIGGNVFLGHGIYNGNISKYFTNQYFIGINVDIHRNNIIFQIDDYIGFGKIKQTLTFPDQLEWKKDKLAMSFMIGGNIGYSLVNTKNFKFAPIAGIGGNILTSSFSSTNENSVNEPFIPFYKVGFFIDLKSLVLLQDHVRINNKDENYTSVRLSCGIDMPIGKTKFSNYYHGSMFYITIGMGGLSRRFERK